MDHGVKVASVLANSFSRRCSYIAESDAHVKEKAIQFGFVLGKCWGRGGNTQLDTSMCVSHTSMSEYEVQLQKQE